MHPDSKRAHTHSRVGPSARIGSIGGCSYHFYFPHSHYLNAHATTAFSIPCLEQSLSRKKTQTQTKNEKKSYNKKTQNKKKTRNEKTRNEKTRNEKETPRMYRPLLYPRAVLTVLLTLVLIAVVGAVGAVDAFDAFSVPVAAAVGS